MQQSYVIQSLGEKDFLVNQSFLWLSELPAYKVPSLLFVCNSMLERENAYIVKAGTIILACNTVVQVMATFTLLCFTALGALNSEMKSGKWLTGAIEFQLAA